MILQTKPTNKYPIYIVSKGRWESRLTAKALDKLGVSYYMVVEEQEYEKYCEVTPEPEKRVLILDKKYQDEYDTFDDLGYTKGKGPGAARNFAWDHSISLGAARHWVMDDNILDFYRLNRNLRIRVRTPAIFAAAEDFNDRYENLYISGFCYRMFRASDQASPPFILNTRVYSCLLIQNEIPYRWRGRYNEDTDLSLRVLKDGHCVLQFAAFLQDKLTTQVLGGGNTAEFYAHEGTLPKSQMLVKMHPDVAEVVKKYDRWHHYVDYSPFRHNRLIKKPNLIIPKENNEYGMKLIKIQKDSKFW